MTKFIEYCGQCESPVIADCPDCGQLLEACKEMWEFIDGEFGIGIENGYWPEIKPMWEKGKAAIKAAEGDNV